MNEKSEQSEVLTDSLAEGIGALMAADEVLEQSEAVPEDLADLFLGELNRLWLEHPAEQAA